MPALALGAAMRAEALLARIRAAPLRPVVAVELLAGIPAAAPVAGI
jgi:hypothetical protein